VPRTLLFFLMEVNKLDFFLSPISSMISSVWDFSPCSEPYIRSDSHPKSSRVILQITPYFNVPIRPFKPVFRHPHLQKSILPFAHCSFSSPLRWIPFFLSPICYRTYPSIGVCASILYPCIRNLLDIKSLW